MSNFKADIYLTVVIATSVIDQMQDIMIAVCPSMAMAFTSIVCDVSTKEAMGRIGSGYIPSECAEMLVSASRLVDLYESVGGVITLKEAAALLASTYVSANPPFPALALLDLELAATGRIV